MVSRRLPDRYPPCVMATTQGRFKSKIITLPCMLLYFLQHQAPSLEGGGLWHERGKACRNQIGVHKDRAICLIGQKLGRKGCLTRTIGAGNDYDLLFCQINRYLPAHRKLHGTMGDKPGIQETSKPEGCRDHCIYGFEKWRRGGWIARRVLRLAPSGPPAASKIAPGDFVEPGVASHPPSYVPLLKSMVNETEGLRNVAERVGFEPTEGVNPRRFSRPVLSTTQPPLRFVVLLEARILLGVPGLDKPFTRMRMHSPRVGLLGASCASPLRGRLRRPKSLPAILSNPRRA